MKRIALSLAASCAAALSACGGNSPVADKAENAGSLPAPATVNSSDPSGAAPPPNALSRSTADTSSGGGRLAAIPSALQGRWSLNPAECTRGPGRGQSLLVISGDELRFYESVARPKANASADRDRYSADFAFTGEGQSWTRFQSLEIQDGRLVRTESSPMASYTYAKCS